MKWHSTQTDKVLDELHTKKSGLSDSEARQKKEKYGANELKREKKISPLKIFLDQFKDFLVIILIIAAIISYASGFFGEGGGTVEAILIIIIIVANGIFGFIQEFKAEKSIEQLKKMTSKVALVIRNGQKKKIEAIDLVPGDILVLQEGDILPADARIIEAYNLTVDESSLTGESVPVSKNSKTFDEKTPLADRKNVLFMSTSIVRGSGLAVITDTGMSTEVGKIAKKIQEAETRLTPFQIELEKLGKKIGKGVLIIAVIIILTLLATQFSSLNLQTIVSIFIVGVSLAVAAVPEGLPIVVTLALALGSKRMVKKKALVRNLSVVESLGSVDVICSDKTGTLTEGRMTVRKIFFDNQIIEVTGRGYDLKGDFILNKKHVDPRKMELILKTGFLCNNAEIKSTEDFFGDPTEVALLVSAMKGGVTKEILKSHEKVNEIPFSSERKMMSVIFKNNDRNLMFTKGALEVVLLKCTQIIETGKIVTLTPKKRQEIIKINEEFASDALRVLGFAYKVAKDNKEKDLIFLGLQGMIDPPRTEVLDAISDCRNAGIRVVMITGDHKLTAQAIAKELRFKNVNALTGQELDELSEQELEEVVKEISIFARVSPEHKAIILKALQKQHIVAMTGDGVNDAPALKQADVGVSMGIKGTDVAKQSSDMILMDDNFISIRNAVKEGRGIFDNIRKFVNYLLSANAGEVLIVFLATILGVVLGSDHPESWVPLLATHLLWMNILTDGLPALALGADPVSEKVMKRKPRPKEEGVINKRMMFSILTIGASLGLIELVLFMLNHADVVRARTIVFTSLVVFELVRIQNIRSRYSLSFFSNKWLVLAIGLSLALQLMVVYTPLNQFFEIVALSLNDWIQIGIGLAVFYILSKSISIFEDKLFPDQK